MSARIRHLALYTENQTGMANFYKTVFGMKRITESLTNPSRACQRRRDWARGARNPWFSFRSRSSLEVDDVGVILERPEKYPKVLVTKGLEQVAFAVFRSHDPAGTQFDISWKQHPKVQEGYKDDGWKQPRQINHIAIRSAEPERVVEFYHEVFDLKEGKNFYDEDAFCVTDGTVDLAIRRTSNHSYMSMREGIDHFGYAVESIEEVKKDLDEFGRANPGSAPKELAGGVFGHITQEDIDGCKIGEFAIADPDGLLLDLSARTA
jgi:catechol 2,3-dioxygenase-like lactoylglutathione lyase family enzyme